MEILKHVSHRLRNGKIKEGTVCLPKEFANHVVRDSLVSKKEEDNYFKNKINEEKMKEKLRSTAIERERELEAHLKELRKLRTKRKENKEKKK